MRKYRFQALCLGAAAAALASSGCQSPSRAGTPRAGASSASIRFSDVTNASKLDWRHVNGASGRFFYPELVGGGGGFVDVNGDGWLDIVLINSGPLPGYKGKPGHHGVYLNNGDGTFRDLSQKSGLKGPAYGMGVAAADYDGDGATDLYVTGVGEGRLYKNDGTGVFTDVTTPELKNEGHWGTSAAWVDLNADRRLDLLIGNYVRWSQAVDIPCFERGIRTNCGPTSYKADRCTLLLGQKGGGFQDATRTSGLADVPSKALGVVTLDFDSDAKLDVAVACDLQPNLLLRNAGGGRLEDVALEQGIALSERGLARAGMGIDALEERKGRWSIWIGNLTKEGSAYFRQSEGGIFQDAAASLGLEAATLKVLTFGLAADDFDRDGNADFALANGHVDIAADRTRDEDVYQKPKLFQQQVGGAVVDVSEQAGEPFQQTYLGRALARGDYDNDGDTDLLLVQNNGAVHLLRNETSSPNQWVGLVCVTSAGTPALGTRIELTQGKTSACRWVRTDGSYLSSNDPRCVFSLGGASRPFSVEVRWPDGPSETHSTLTGGTYWKLEQGKAPERLR